MVVLGDREFCGLRELAQGAACVLCLRLKRSEFIQIEGEIWVQLNALGLALSLPIPV